MIRHRGSWAAALALAGLPPAPRQPRGPDRREIAEALRAYEREHGVRPSVTVWRRAQLKPGVKVIYRRFGSWSAALAYAGLPTHATPRHPAGTR
jgi:Homing endonuclease associated repeat